MKTYLINCVQAKGEDISEMIELAREIKYTTFLSHIDTQELATLFPMYKNSGLTIKNDYHVRYYSSKYRGVPCVFVVHSAIEYVFV
jgi:hypothetical protein